MEDQNSDRDPDLDAALTTYAAVKLRAGLEKRVLANLRAERQRLAAHRRRWPALAALVVAVSIALVSAGWRISGTAFNAATGSGSASRENIANDSRLGITAQSNIGKLSSEADLLARAQSTGDVRAATANHAAESSQTETAAHAAPKFERFPVPEPLSEQEKLLVQFAENNPREAALVAEARAEQLQREDAEMKEFGAKAEEAQHER